LIANGRPCDWFIEQNRDGKWFQVGESIELFNPVNEMFYETNLPLMDRPYMFSSLIGNKVYFYGGPLDRKYSAWNAYTLAEKEAAFNSTMVLDLETETLSSGPALEFTGAKSYGGCMDKVEVDDMNTSEIGMNTPSSWILNEHEILVFCTDTSYSFIFSFDPATGKLVKPPFSIQGGDKGNEAVFDGDRYIYYRYGSHDYGSLIRFDIQSYTKTTVATYTFGTGKRLFYNSSNKLIYLFGGTGTGNLGNATTTSDILAYDTLSGKISKVAELPEPMNRQTPVMLPNGRILLLGGAPPANSEDFNSNTQMIFDPKTNTAGYTGKMLGKRQNFVCAQLPTGRILLIGAESNVQDSEIFEPEANVYVVYDKTRIPAGASYQFQVEYAKGVVNWTAEQGSIDSTGLYTAPWSFAINKDWITATSTTDDTKWGKVPMNLVRAEDVLLVSVPLVVTSNNPAQLEVAVFWFDNKNVTWGIESTPKDAVATIDSTGLFTTDKPGDYEVRVTSAVDSRYTTIQKITVK